MIIPIFRGDDTNFNNSLFLTVNIASTFDLNGFTAELVLGGGAVSKNAVLGENGAFEVAISAEESKLLPFGDVKGSVILIDKEGRRRTIATDILFNVTNEVTEDLEYTADLSVTETEATVLNIKVGGGTGGGGTTDYNELKNKPSIAGVALMNDVSLADIGAASSGDIAQSTQAILTLTNEQTAAILEKEDENASDIKANTDTKAAEILTAVDESETAITSAVSAAQADIKADIAELKESTGGGSSVSLDAAFMEVLSGLDKQKQILAQALTDKGVEVSSADTLDTMASKVKEMDVVGAQDKVICEFHNQFNSDVSYLSSKIGSSFARIIFSKNALVSRTSGGIFGIYKLSDDGTLVEIASCDCSDFVSSDSGITYQILGFSKSAEYIAWFDSKLQKLILFRMDWNTNSLTRVLSYTTTTANLGTNGSGEYLNSSYCYLGGLVPSEDGSKVCILSTNKNYYLHSTVIDVASQTETTNIGTNANACNLTNSDYVLSGTYHWDTTTGIIECSTSRRPLFQLSLDLTKEIPFLSFVGDKITNTAGGYSDSYYGIPLFLWDKGLMLQIASNTNSSSISNGKPITGTLFLKDINTGVLLDSVIVSVDRSLSLDKSYGTYYGYLKTTSYHVPFVTKKSGKILVGFGPFMRFELDEENKKLIPYKHNGAKQRDGGYVCFGLIYSNSNLNSSNSSYSYHASQYLYCENNPDLIFCVWNIGYYNNVYSSSYTVTIFYEEPCVLGLYYNRNGAKNLLYPTDFTYTKYKAGEFADKDSVAVVNVESGEAE